MASDDGILSPGRTKASKRKRGERPKDFVARLEQERRDVEMRPGLKRVTERMEEVRGKQERAKQAHLTGKPQYIPRKVGYRNERQRMEKEAQAYSVAKAKGQEALEKYQLRQKQKEHDRQERERQHDEARLKYVEAKAEQDVSEVRKAHWQAEAETLRQRLRPKQTYEEAHALYREAKRKAPRASFRLGGLGETVTRPRATSMPKKLKAETTPSTWGRAATEPWDTWGSAKPAPLRTWGETEPVRKAKTSAVTGVSKRKKEVKSQAKPARAEPSLWEKTYRATTPTKAQRIKQMRAKEQPRVQGRFAKKVISEYDLEPKDFFTRQYAKLQKGEISVNTYARYARLYEQKTGRKYKAPHAGLRYRLTVQVTGDKDGEEIIWRVTMESNGVQLTPKMEKDLMERVKGRVEGSIPIKVKRLKLYGVYDTLIVKRLSGGGYE